MHLAYFAQQHASTARKLTVGEKIIISPIDFSEALLGIMPGAKVKGHNNLSKNFHRFTQKSCNIFRQIFTKITFVHHPVPRMSLPSGQLFCDES